MSLTTREVQSLNEAWRKIMLILGYREDMLGASGFGDILNSATGEIPDQTGHNGEFLTTNGTAASWAAVSLGNWTFSGNGASTSGSPMSLTVNSVLAATLSSSRIMVFGDGTANGRIGTTNVYTNYNEAGGSLILQSGGSITLTGVKAAYDVPIWLGGGAGALDFTTALNVVDCRIYRANTKTLTWDDGAGGAATLRGAILTVDSFIQGAGGAQPVLEGAKFDTGTFVTKKVGSPLVAGATITPTDQLHHVTGHAAAIDTITAPASFTVSGYGGQITLIFDDAAATWTNAGNIAVAGAATTAGAAVIFTYDNATSKWYPSRVA